MKRGVSRIQLILSLLLFIFLTTSHASADKVSYTYDDMGRLTKADYGTTAIIYSYDSAGNILKVITGPDLGCPLVLALEKQEHINRLRNFKDRRLGTSAQKDLVSLYYKHALEASLILMGNPPLRRRVRELVVNNLTTFDELTVKDTVLLDQGMVDEVLALLNELENAGSAGLKRDVRSVRGVIEDGSLLDTLGIGIE